MAEEPIKVSFKVNKTDTTKTLSYPRGKVYQDFTDYVRFDFYKYKPPFQSVTGKAGVDKDGKAVQGSGSYDLYNSSSVDLERNPKLPYDTILLYMPEDISTGTQSEWGGKGFTNPAAGLLRSSGNAVAGNAAGTAQAVADSIGKLFQKGPSVGATAIAAAINNMPGGIGGDVGIQDVLAGVGGVILNPNTELMFTGFTLRNFDLNFKLAPRNGDEADEIRKIVNTFKKASLPDYSSSAQDFWNKTANWLSNGEEGKKEDQNSNYIGVPSLCKVTFMSGSEAHPYLSQFKTSAITKVDINYTPDGAYATYGGSLGNAQKSPVAIELSLSFTETKLVYQDDVFTQGATY
jgi:hypothetical protein